MSSEKVAIVGSGLIGRSWAMLFASKGYKVFLYDISQELVEQALVNIEEQLKLLETKSMLRGNLTAEEQRKQISGSKTLEECVQGAIYVQECVPENVALKREVFKEIDKFVDNITVMASSTSCILPSQFTEDLKHRANTIVAHPVNPPFYVPLVELVPAPWTHPGILIKTRTIMEEIGQKPVTLSKEMPGFALNRIQYAILNECWRLVEDGVLSVADVDTVMVEGLAPRYAFMGPLETAHLNAAGMLNYCQRYGETVWNVSQTFGPIPRMASPSAENVHKELCKKVPVEKLEERRAWRDVNLSLLAKLKAEINK